MGPDRTCFRPTLRRPGAADFAAALAVALFPCKSQGSEGLLGLGEASGEVAAADDIILVQTNTRADLRFGVWDTSLSIAFSGIEIDYEPVPFDFNGFAITRRELNTALQVRSERAISEAWTVLIGAGGYLGYTNYRSVWLDEYYYQQFADFPPLPGFDTYKKADPRGIHGVLGARWGHQGGNTFVQFTASQLSDHVAPGYEIDFDGLFRTPEVLATTALNLDLENILTPHIRSRVRLRAAKTSERDWRFGTEGWLNLAMGESWIARLNFGYTQEAPEFEAVYGGVTVERPITDSLSAIISGRFYHDTGEIENALLFTSSAPELDSWEAGLGFRWIGNPWSGRILLGFLQSAYGDTNPNTDFFQNLYADRDWVTGQVAVSCEF